MWTVGTPAPVPRPHWYSPVSPHPAPLGPADRRDGIELRVMTVNVRVGGADAATIVRLVRDNRIDLLAVQEYTPGARDNLRAAGLDALLPYRLDDAEPLAVGSALFSWVPLQKGDFSVAPGGFVEVTATLDHVLVDSRIGVRSVTVHAVPDTDHRAVVAVLAIPG